MQKNLAIYTYRVCVCVCVCMDALRIFFLLWSLLVVCRLIGDSVGGARYRLDIIICTYMHILKCFHIYIYISIHIWRKHDHDNRVHFHCLLVSLNAHTYTHIGFVFPPVYIIYLRSSHKS